MLYVKTKIGPSKIHGIGLFAAVSIPKGTLVWKFVSGYDQVFTKEQINSLPKSAKEQALNYGYLNPNTGKYVLVPDDARFMNHSESPNIIDIPTNDGRETEAFASVDIKSGEEITCNYRSFDADFQKKLNL